MSFTGSLWRSAAIEIVIEKIEIEQCKIGERRMYSPQLDETSIKSFASSTDGNYNL